MVDSVIGATPADRRERHKLILEYVKIILSSVALAALGLAGLQWQDGNAIADHTVYQRMASDWKDHLALFIEKPQLRPYFEEKKELGDDDPLRGVVLAVADVRLHVMDTILTYVSIRWHDSEFEEWNDTFKNAFRSGPVLCARLRDARSVWDEDLIDLADEVCPKAGSPQSN